MACIDVQRGPVDGRVQQQRIQLEIVLDVGFLLAFLHLVQRRLRDVDVAPFDQDRHLAVEESEQQRADVRTVDVGIRHDDDAVIAQFVDVEVVAAYAATERRDERADLRRREHLVEARLLDIQNLALQRQDGLRTAVAALLRGAARGITLHQEHLGQGGILLLTIRQLSGKTGDVERTFAPGHLTRLARGLARVGGLQDFVDDRARLLRMLQQKLLEPRGHRGFDHTLHFGGHQLVLGL